MGKKKDKSTDSKKTKTEKNETAVKGGTLTDNQPVSAIKSDNRGLGKLADKKLAEVLQSVKQSEKQTAKPNKAVVGGIVAIAISALAFAAMNIKSTDDAPQAAALSSETASQPAVGSDTTARAVSEAAAASLIPPALAPQKVQLAQPTTGTSEPALHKNSKENKKAVKLTNKAKGKEIKKVATTHQKPKIVKHDNKKVKKTLAVKTGD